MMLHSHNVDINDGGQYSFLVLFLEFRSVNENHRLYNSLTSLSTQVAKAKNMNHEDQLVMS